MRCYAYSFASSFSMKSLRTYLANSYDFNLFEDVFHIKYLAENLNEEKDVFIFSSGSFVSWGLDQYEEQSLIQELQKCLSNDKLGAHDDDLYDYQYGQQISIKRDMISLPNKSIETKLACSHGLAQSVKLGGFEETLQNMFSLTTDLPERLAKEGGIHLSRKAIRKLMGRLYVDRTSINLHLELLSEPNFFWENPELEPIHEVTVRYVDLSNRVKILNQRLDIIKDLLDMLANELNNQHSSMLEWTIIILIATEIGLMLFKEIFHVF